MKYLFLTSLIIFSSSCSNENIFKPVEIKYGQDICEACSMIISEKEYSAQYLLQDDKVKKFDDIGCMMHFIKDNKNENGNISAVFVRDFNSKNWINAKNAHFFQSNKITTPMGHGIIAFARKEDLKDVKSTIGGKELRNLLIPQL
jgi:copper chaperone NosL